MTLLMTSHHHHHHLFLSLFLTPSLLFSRFSFVFNIHSERPPILPPTRLTFGERKEKDLIIPERRNSSTHAQPNPDISPKETSNERTIFINWFHHYRFSLFNRYSIMQLIAFCLFTIICSYSLVISAPVNQGKIFLFDEKLI